MIRIVVIATVDWAQITRLCLALADGGFKVTALAPAHHGMHRMPTIDVGLLGRTRIAALRSISRTVEQFLFFNDMPTDESYTLSLHDALTGARAPPAPR